MKNILFNFIILACTINIYNAQVNSNVGINTTTPTKTLDINGNLTVRKTQDKKNESNYNRVLTTNNDGEIEYINKSDILIKMKDGIMETTKLNTTENSKKSNIVSCGRFDFKFNNNTIPQIRLHYNDNPKPKIYYSRIKKVNGTGLRFKDSDNTTRSITTNQVIDFSATQVTQNDGWANLSEAYKSNDQDEYFISYPGIENLYRVTFTARTNAITNSGTTYTIICEKF